MHDQGHGSHCRAPRSNVQHPASSIQLLHGPPPLPSTRLRGERETAGCWQWHHHQIATGMARGTILAANMGPAGRLTNSSIQPGRSQATGIHQRHPASAKGQQATLNSSANTKRGEIKSGGVLHTASILLLPELKIVGNWRARVIDVRKWITKQPRRQGQEQTLGHSEHGQLSQWTIRAWPDLTEPPQEIFRSQDQMWSRWSAQKGGQRRGKDRGKKDPNNKVMRIFSL